MNAQSRIVRLVNAAGVEIVDGRTYECDGALVAVVGRAWETSEGWRCAIEPVGSGAARNVFVDELARADSARTAKGRKSA